MSEYNFSLFNNHNLSIQEIHSPTLFAAHLLSHDIRLYFDQLPRSHIKATTYP
ncbi:MAG: hypothetical protein ACI9CF_001059, partial [Candidatus Omnitrophota bacterium]